MSSANLILVVDDEQNIRLLVRATLETEGYTVHEATSSEDAIAALEHETPAVVLLDLRMPPGRDGMAVLEHLNQRPPDQRPRVIVLTAHGGVPQAVQAIRLGASDFLQKPTTPEDLRLSIAAAIQEQREQHPHAQPHAPTMKLTSPDVGYSEILLRVRHAVWNKDIRHTEHLLSELFHKAAAEPAFYNVLAVVFEAEGNRGAAKTFYQKAVALGASEAARQNLLRLDELQLHGTTSAEVSLGDQAEFLDNLCGHAVAHR